MPEMQINRQSSQQKKSKVKGRFFSRLLKVFLLCLIIGFGVVGAGTITVVSSFVNDAPDFKTWVPQASLTSHIYDRSGNEIATFYGHENRIHVPLEQIPLHVQKAFIAIEDERFYQHMGLDPIALGRAFLVNLRQGNWTEQGGSTITQQLVKNTLLSHDKTFSRKFKEAWLAIRLELQFSKSEILEMYLNQIYFAHGAYGIEAAARNFFDKPASELSIAEAALLAGIPRSPNFYSPYLNPEAALQRRGLVLQKMYELDFISEMELHNANQQEINLSGLPGRDYPFPYFMDYVLHNELLGILTGLPQFNSRAEAYEAVYTKGLKVYTTIDTNAQSAAENALHDESLYRRTFRVDMGLLKQLMESGEYYSYPEEVLTEEGIPQPQSALVVADPATGEILALVGGREYGPGNQSLRYLSPRQPGSAIKPIVAYAPALEENLITAGSIIDDSPFIRGNWAPENFGGEFLGLVTVRETLVRSLNVPAAKLFEGLTPKVGLDYAEKMGITTIHPDDYNLAASLGGLTRGVTAFDMAQAYAVLANGGYRVDLHTIKRIEDKNGDLLFERNPVSEPVLSPQTAYMITDMLKDVVRRGTASNLTIVRPLAAKTGTTSDNRDAYLVAYTPDVVVSFWMGHDIQRLGRIDGGSSSAIPFINAILSQILQDVPPSDFTRPQGLVGPVKICSKSGLLPGPACPAEHITQEIFPETEVPRDRCDLHVILTVCTRSGNLASYFCPSRETVRSTFLLRPEFQLTDERWRGAPGRGPEDAALMPPTEYCEEHSWWNRYRFW